MYTDDIKTPFRWYTSEARRNEYTLNCEGVCDFRLIAPNDSLLPFQIIRRKSNAPITSWVMTNISTGQVFNMNVSKLMKVAGPVYDVFAYLAEAGDPTVDAAGMPCGYYYSQITDGTNTWYSEKIYLVDEFDEACYTKLEWSNSCSIDGLQVVDGYVNRLYLEEAEVHQAEPRYIEEGKENGERQFIATYQKMQVVYKIDTGLIPQYLWESLLLLRMFDSVTIQLNRGKGTLTANEIQVSAPVWEFDEKCLATGVISFVGFEVVKDKCCSDNDDCLKACMSAIPDPGSGYTPGVKYMNSDGRVKEYQENGDFIFFTCESAFVYNPVDGLHYSYVDGSWQASPSILSIEEDTTETSEDSSDDGTMQFRIKAVGIPGTTGELFIDGISAGSMSAEDWYSTGLLINLWCRNSYSMYISFTQGTCDYGSSNPTTFYMPCEFSSDLIDMSDYSGASKWTGVVVAGVTHIINVPINDFDALVAAVDAVIGDNGVFTVETHDDGTWVIRLCAADNAYDFDGLVIYDPVAATESAISFTKECGESNIKLRSDTSFKLRSDYGKKLRS